MAETISADYLVIGAGAMGMAFVDTMMTDTKATIALVDRYHTPGGHWTMAYPFVRLHQPSAYYGVNSKDLGQDKVDEVGWNKGLAELASGDEICAYYSQVMSEQFLPSGRVQYYPKCEYTGDGEFRSIITDKTYRVGQDTRIVNAAFLKVNVPSMGPPAYKVEQGVNLVTVNNLARITRPYSNYTVVGGGKTSMDACLWLLANGIEHSRITWIQPRPAWLLLREK